MTTPPFDELQILVLRPGFVAAGSALNLEALNNSSPPAYQNIAVGDSVQDEIRPPPGVTTVDIIVLDDGARAMSVTVDGTTWARNETAAVPYSYGAVDIPAEDGDTKHITLIITTQGALPRSQVVIIKRRPVPFLPSKVKNDQIRVFVAKYAAGQQISLKLINMNNKLEDAPEKVPVEICPSFGISTVVIHVLDDPNHVISVAPVGGRQWSRNELARPRYSYAAINIPPTEETTYRLDLKIASQGALDRPQVITLKRKESL